MLMDTKRATTRQVTPWPHTKHYKERRWAFVFTNVIFWYHTGLFLFCSRDKADRHTPILIEDENLFTAFDDLPLDDTWNKRDPEPYQDINVLLLLGLGENPQINLLGQVIIPNNHSHETMNTYLGNSSHSKSMFFHQRMIYHRYNSMMIHLKDQIILFQHHTPHHPLIQVWYEHNLRQDTEVLFRIDNNLLVDSPP